MPLHLKRLASLAEFERELTKAALEKAKSARILFDSGTKYVLL
ncbi:hypothetical protein [Pontibacter actiniarum]|nr:hypothetical protein [Pontibacter actiniarum]